MSDDVSMYEYIQQLENCVKELEGNEAELIARICALNDALQYYIEKDDF